jgi:hypothetical protein
MPTEAQMPEPIVDEYLATVRPDAHATVLALAAAVDDAEAGLECRIAWQMLVYALDGRWRDWVVAIGVSKSVVNLRFLHGDLLKDPGGLLRAGSSTMMTIDCAAVGDVQPAIFTTYVREAAQQHPRP